MKKKLTFLTVLLLSLMEVQAQYWNLTGNAGTSSSTNFVGTTDANSLIFKVNNQFSGFIDISNYNAGLGYMALVSNTSGGGNSAFGYKALEDNTTGYYNTATGLYSLNSNTTGVGNTAYGFNTMLSSVTTNHNTAIGYASMKNMTGSYNTAVGYNSLRDDYYGSYNTAIGYDANINSVSATYTNSTAVGYNSRITASNQIRLGNSSVTSIGGYASWSNISDGRFKKDIRDNVPGLSFIKALKPVTYHLDISGLERKLHPDASAEVTQTEGIKASITAKEHLLFSGFIAQDVEAAAKKLGYEFSGVDAPGDKDGLYALRYAEFVVPLVKAVQELSSANDSLKEQVSSLQGQMKQVLEQLNALKAGSSNTVPTVQTGYLQQNSPNPFNSNTLVKYHLPSAYGTAQLLVSSAAGQVVKVIRLTGNGDGQLTLAAGSFAAGTYFYTLAIDGRNVDSKQMVLTR